MGGSHPHPAKSTAVTGSPGYYSSIGPSSPAFNKAPKHQRHRQHIDSRPNGAPPTPSDMVKQVYGGAKQPNGVAKQPNGVAKQPNGVAKQPNGVAKQPNGVAKHPNGVVSKPKGPSPKPNGVALRPNGVAMTPRPDQPLPQSHMRGMGLKRHDVSASDDGTRSLASLTSELHQDAGDDVLFDYVANSVVGKDLVIDGPFGQRKVLYLDYIASGKPLTFLEEFISKEVLPTYANTHTTTSATARQTTTFRNEARAIIQRTTNCTEDDVVIFTGTGVTGAIHKLIYALNITEPPVVFVGPFEHHSNILPWREMKAQIIRIGQTADGLVDVHHLEEELKKVSGSGRRLIGSFSAASNVTGILVDTVAISILLHRYGALALWDCATAAPYVHLDMNPSLPGNEDESLAYKDAIFVSPHKFVGGTDTPGVLIAKKHLFLNRTPHHCGGGTVLVVRKTGHRFLENLEEREEGGTPSIVGAIRAGLVFQLKDAITAQRIMQREQQLFRVAREFWQGVPNLVVLGNMGVERLPIFSFLVHHPFTGYYLHHNFVACLLNDLFGIQARGGCACAGPYAMDLLGISEEQAMGIENLLIAETKSARRKSAPESLYGESQRDIFKPGFTRFNLPYFLTEDQVLFVFQAVAMVAEHGWKLLPQYKFNPKTGEWKHELSQEAKQQKHLDQLSYDGGYMKVQLPKSSGQEETLPQSLQDCLEQARRIIDEASKNVTTIPDQSHLFEDFARSSRWFLLPSEASEVLQAFSHIRDLGPAHPLLVPNQTPGHLQGSSPTELPMSNGSLPTSRMTTVTGLGGTLSPTENGKEKKKGEFVLKIRVNDSQPSGPRWRR